MNGSVKAGRSIRNRIWNISSIAAYRNRSTGTTSDSVAAPEATTRSTDIYYADDKTNEKKDFKTPGSTLKYLLGALMLLFIGILITVILHAKQAKRSLDEKAVPSSGAGPRCEDDGRPKTVEKCSLCSLGV